MTEDGREILAALNFHAWMTQPEEGLIALDERDFIKAWIKFRKTWDEMRPEREE